MFNKFAEIRKQFKKCGVTYHESIEMTNLYLKGVSLEQIAIDFKKNYSKKTNKIKKSSFVEHEYYLNDILFEKKIDVEDVKHVWTGWSVN